MFDEVGILYYFLEFFDGVRKLEHPVSKLLVVAAIVGFTDTWSADEEKRTGDDKKKSWSLLAKTSSNRDFHNLLLIPISYQSGSFAIIEKGGNRLVPGPDYMVDALKLPKQAPRVSGDSLQKCVAWRCPDGTQLLFCWPILTVSGQSLASKGPVVDS
ncbi:hypothetical protein TNCV_4610711 [Trichonephila clavipes]|nr:hypothetical protein TNCV_4610711 [Trichonephila clavipes]